LPRPGMPTSPQRRRQKAFDRVGMGIPSLNTL
jgi:hypothetical protein